MSGRLRLFATPSFSSSLSSSLSSSSLSSSSLSSSVSSAPRAPLHPSSAISLRHGPFFPLRRPYSDGHFSAGSSYPEDESDTDLDRMFPSDDDLPAPKKKGKKLKLVDPEKEYPPAADMYKTPRLRPSSHAPRSWKPTTLRTAYDLPESSAEENEEGFRQLPPSMTTSEDDQEKALKKVLLHERETSGDDDTKILERMRDPAHQKALKLMLHNMREVSDKEEAERDLRKIEKGVERNMTQDLNYEFPTRVKPAAQEYEDDFDLLEDFRDKLGLSSSESDPADQEVMLSYARAKDDATTTDANEDAPFSGNFWPQTGEVRVENPDFKKLSNKQLKRVFNVEFDQDEEAGSGKGEDSELAEEESDLTDKIALEHVKARRKLKEDMREMVPPEGDAFWNRAHILNEQHQVPVKRENLEEAFKKEHFGAPPDDMIERENFAMDPPTKLQRGEEAEIHPSEKYDKQKRGRYLQRPKQPKVEPLYWHDVEQAFKEKGEEEKLDDVRHAWDAITTACHVHFSQTGQKRWNWNFIRRTAFKAPKPTVKPRKELGFMDDEAPVRMRQRKQGKTTPMYEPMMPPARLNPLSKLPQLPEFREPQINYDGSTRAGGRRKTATAHVRLTPGTGRIVVNKTDFTEYFDKFYCRELVMQPFYMTERLCAYDVYAKTRGGGIFSQAEAIRLAVSKALQKQCPSHRLVLRRAMLLKRDPRMVERKKTGQPKAHKKKQWSKR